LQGWNEDLHSISGSELKPNQCGVGTKGGAEAIIHSVTYLMDKHIDDPEIVCGLIDAKNAFNLCNRQAFLDETLKIFPGTALSLSSTAMHQ
jgi:hypothetical protein